MGDAASGITVWQVLALLFSGVSTAGVLGIFYRLGMYTQKVDGHDVKFCEVDKRIDKVEAHDAKQDGEIRLLEQKWSCVSHLP